MTTSDEIRNELLTHIQDILGRNCTDEDLDAIEDALAICLAGAVWSRSLLPELPGLEAAMVQGAIEGIYSAMNEVSERN